jgi:N-acetylneuraminate synthase
MMNNKFKIENRIIGDNEPPVVIAELGINHNGSLDKAISIAESAIKSGAEIIKHQTHVVKDEMIDAAKKVIPGNSNKSIYEIISKCALNEKEEKKLMQHIRKLKAIFISTPFSRAAADRLQKFNIPAFKIGSGECNNYPLIEHIAKFKKPVILSTGMNSIKTIIPAVKILRKYKIKYALMHCTNIYPTPPELVRLDCLTILKKNFPDAVIGLSDHTTSNFTSFGAIALGAKIIERHYVKNTNSKGPDVSCSMSPIDLKNLLIGCKTIYQSTILKSKKPLKQEKKTIDFAFASVVSIKDILPGERLTKKNIWVKRPGKGDFLAKDYNKLLGKKIKKRIISGEYIRKKYF